MTLLLSNILPSDRNVNLPLQKYQLVCVVPTWELSSTVGHPFGFYSSGLRVVASCTSNFLLVIFFLEICFAFPNWLLWKLKSVIISVYNFYPFLSLIFFLIFLLKQKLVVVVTTRRISSPIRMGFMRPKYILKLKWLKDYIS